jgi:hypothetical protein
VAAFVDSNGNSITSVTVPSGQTSVEITVATYATSTTQTAVLIAGDDPTGCKLTVTPGGATLALLPNSVIGGQQVATGVLNLSAIAPKGGVTINLSTTPSSQSAINIPSTVKIPAGDQAYYFPISTNSVAEITTITIIATLGSGTGAPTSSASITVNPVPPVGILTILPLTVTGGADSIGIFTLTNPAPAGGLTVTLASSNSAVASPAVSSIQIPAGSTTAVFVINTLSVTSSSSVGIEATALGQTLTEIMTVTPP